ncbi:uncharacterized protein LOC142625007 [Castanea sativa]|uniref:uncharacterized protein LOC142625007 n=1 Tax=Castanea sativa TaxID=21020 RepID=UPI003F64D415
MILGSDCDTELFAMISWTLWFRCNKSSFSPSGIPLEQVLQHAYEGLQEFWTANQPAQLQRVRPRERWSDPHAGLYRINFDGALFTSLDRARIGVIIWDCNGLVMASLSQAIPLPLTVLETETVAVARALEFALELGLDSVILEGDYEILMKSLMQDSLSLATSGLLIQDVKVIAESFQCISFSHVRREGNKVAHNLVRHAYHVTGFSVWMKDVPSHTLVSYQADLPIS